MNLKILEFILLRGTNWGDSLLIQKEKFSFLWNRILRILIKTKPLFTLGKTLPKSVKVKNSYSIFLCRKETFDLQIISGSYKYLVYKLFKFLAKKSKIIVDVGANFSFFNSSSNYKFVQT